MYAGCRRFALLHLHHGAGTISHVSAHRSYEVMLQLKPERRLAAFGNYHADLAAKAAVLQHHPQPAPVVQQGLEHRSAQAEQIIKVMASVLILFPPEKFGRVSAEPATGDSETGKA